MIKLTPSEFVKYNWRASVFARKYKSGEVFKLASGGKMKFIYQPDVEKEVLSRNTTRLGKVKLIGRDGKEYKLSALGKTEEFGGRGKGSSTVREDMELKRLREQLDEIKLKTGYAAVPIKIGRKVYQVSDVATTPGTPKSDFHLLDLNDNEIVWISHKYGTTPRDFQQWGGISAKNEPVINKHPEVQQFLKDMNELYPEGVPRATNLYRTIKDNKLKMMSVYGSDFHIQNRNLGRQNVSILIQGPVRLRKSNSTYQFTSHHIHINGARMLGGFEPVLTASYRSDRNDGGVKNTRITISPIGGRNMIGQI